MTHDDWNDLVKSTQDPSLIAMYATSSGYQEACSFALYVMHEMDIKDSREHRCVIVQYSPIFIQAIRKNKSLKDALLSYEYPDGLGDLTKDVTDQFDILPDGLLYRLFPEFVELPFSIRQNGDFFRMDTRHVVINEKQILLLD